MEKNIEVLVADENHKSYIPDILAAIYEASKVKGNSIVMRDPKFWKGCDTCPDYPVLHANQGKSCYCIGLLYRH